MDSSIVLLEDGSTRVWQVTYKDAEGNKKMRICRAGLISGLYWKDGGRSVDKQC
ncbi:MAG: hypothetical protein ABIP97_09310 [Chthoniobacterales bacterium]